MDELFQVVERAKKEWEAVVDSIAEGVALFDPYSLTIRRANWPLARWLATTPKQMVGSNLAEVLCEGPDGASGLNDFLCATINSEMEIQRQCDGRQWVLAVYPVVKESQAGASSVLVIRDVTQERKLQQEVIESERRAAMIRTITGLAHQLIPSVGYIQQQLSTIHAHLDEIRHAFVDYRIALHSAALNAGLPPSELSPTGEAVSSWEDIEQRHQVEFMLSDIDQAVMQSMKDLLHLYKSVDDLGNLDGPEARMKFNDLNQMLENIISSLWPDLRNKISIERRYQKDLPLVRSNQIRLQTALMSLMVYCMRSIYNEGRIRITTSRTEGLVRIAIEAKARYPQNPIVQEDRAVELNPDATATPDPKAGLVQRILAEHLGELVIDAEAPGHLTAIIRLPLEKPLPVETL
jgi:nitrogen-specific signal transduction histidine kinase